MDIAENESNELITKKDNYTNLPVSFWLKDIMYFEVEKRLITAHKADGTKIHYKGSLSNVKEEYGLSGLDAPVQSINCLSFVGVSCNIGTFLAYLYLLKLLVMLAVVCFVCMFSARWSQKVTIGLSVLACIPSILYLAGLSICKYFSVFTMLNINQYLVQIKNVGITVLMCTIFVFIGIGSLYRVYRIWCCNEK